MEREEHLIILSFMSEAKRAVFDGLTNCQLTQKEIAECQRKKRLSIELWTD